jgi:hypothetical protein
MIIELYVDGDRWYNRDEAIKKLNSVDDIAEKIVLKFLPDPGVCLYKLGIINLLDELCANTGRSKKTIVILNNANIQQITDYENLTTKLYKISLYFRYSSNYWRDVLLPNKQAKLLGFFLGRHTIARSAIIYDLYHEFGNDSLLSAMENDAGNAGQHGRWPWRSTITNNLEYKYDLEKISDWVEQKDFEMFDQWFYNFPIKSIDRMNWLDQYRKEDGMKIRDAGILSFYDQFLIELVSETSTLGDNFSITEKTVRPLMAAKPIIVYAPINFLLRLKELGFKTYDSCWDESYDQFEGPVRWAKMKKTIRTIDQFQLDQAQEIALYNREHLKQMIDPINWAELNPDTLESNPLLKLDI